MVLNSFLLLQDSRHPLLSHGKYERSELGTGILAKKNLVNPPEELLRGGSRAFRNLPEQSVELLLGELLSLEQDRELLYRLSLALGQLDLPGLFHEPYPVLLRSVQPCPQPCIRKPFRYGF